MTTGGNLWSRGMIYNVLESEQRTKNEVDAACTPQRSLGASTYF